LALGNNGKYYILPDADIGRYLILLYPVATTQLRKYITNAQYALKACPDYCRTLKTFEWHLETAVITDTINLP